MLSCGTETTSNQIELNQLDPVDKKESANYTKNQIKELKTASKVVYNLPSPAEMADILQKTKAIYDVEILNDPKVSNQYYTDLSRAMNLGVYFADLSFTSMFDYPQQAMLFMSAAQGLSEELNIEGVFTQELMDRLDANLSNKDSIMEIVSFAYLETDLYLQENDQSIMAKAILAGAWIEGLYIATNLKTSTGSNEEIHHKIGMQKGALSNLITMLKDCNEPQLTPLLEKLNELENAFELVEETDTKTENLESLLTLSDKCVNSIKSETSNCRSIIIASPK